MTSWSCDELTGSQSGNNSFSGDGTGFLIYEPFTQLPTPLHDFSSSESSSITLQISRSKTSVFIIYCLFSSSTRSKPFSVFLKDFNFLLFFTATTPHESIITSEFNIHLDNPTDHFSSHFLSFLFSFNMLIIPPTTKTTSRRQTVQ